MDDLIDINEASERLTQYNPGTFTKTPTITPMPKPTPEGSVFSAVFRQEHVVGNVVRRLNNLMPTDETPNFDPIPYIPPQLYDYADRFAGLMSEQQVRWMSDQINQELRDKSIIAGHPARAFFSNIAIGAFDLPGLMIPGGAIYASANRGLGIAMSAASGATAGALSGIATESILQQTQQARTLEESIGNVQGQAFMGLILGAAGGAILNKQVANYAAKEAADTMRGTTETATVFNVSPDGKVTVNKDVPVVKTKDVAGEQITGIVPLIPPDTPGGVAAVVPAPAPKKPPPTGIEIFRGERTGELNYEDVKFSASIANIHDNALRMVKFNPWMRLKTSPLGLSRAVADLIFESRIGTNGTDLENIPMERALESMIKTYGVKYVGLNLDFQKIYFEQRGLGDGGMVDRGSGYAKSVFEQKQLPGLDYDTFSLRVYRAIRDNLIDPDPNVMKAKEFARWKIIDDLKVEAIKVGLLSEDVRPVTADGYLTRIPNRPAIVEDMKGFDAVSMRYVSEVNDQLKLTLPKIDTYNQAIKRADKLLAANEQIRIKISGLEKDLAKTKNLKQKQSIQKKIDELKSLINAQPDELLNQAKELIFKEIDSLQWSEIGGQWAKHMIHSDGVTWRNIKSTEQLTADVVQIRQNYLNIGDDRLANPVLKGVVQGSTKPLMQRAYLIPDSWIEKYVIKDMSTILSYYSRSMSTAIAATKWARNNGFADVGAARSAMKQAIKDEWESKAQGLTGEAASKLKKQLDSDLRDIDASQDILLGIYGRPASEDSAFAKIAKEFMQYNYLRFMGSMMPSAFPDAGSTVLRYGLYETIHNGIVPLLKNPQLRQMAAEYLRTIGVAIQSELGMRIKSQADFGSLSVAHSQWQKVLDKAAQVYPNITLFNQQNDMLQRIAGTLAVHFHLSRIAQFIEKGSVSSKDMRWMMRAGLKKSDFPYYYGQFKKHGSIYDGTYFANVHKWDVDHPAPEIAKAQADAFERFNEAIAKEVRNTVIEPSLQDKPLFVQETLGKVVTQFKSYQFAATNKIFVSSIQNRDDQHTLEGLMTMLALGALGYTVTSLARGNEPDFSFVNLSKEAVDRSGILGMFAEFYNMANKTGLIPGQGVSRFKSRGLIGALFGPTIGTIQDIHDVLTKAVQANNGQPLTTKDVDALLKLMPYQNLFYTHYLTRGLVRKAAANLGAREVPITSRGNR